MLELGTHLKVTGFTQDERVYLPISIGILFEAMGLEKAILLGIPDGRKESRSKDLGQ